MLFLLFLFLGLLRSSLWPEVSFLWISHVHLKRRSHLMLSLTPWEPGPYLPWSVLPPTQCPAGPGAQYAPKKYVPNQQPHLPLQSRGVGGSYLVVLPLTFRFMSKCLFSVGFHKYSSKARLQGWEDACHCTEHEQPCCWNDQLFRSIPDRSQAHLRLGSNQWPLQIVVQQCRC